MTSKFIVAALTSAVVVCAATRVDLKTQSKNPDFSAAVSARPFRTGTVLPLRCEQGDLFFKTDAAPGANSYGCTAADVWTVQGQAAAAGGGTASDAPLAVTRLSDTTLDIGANCTPTSICRIRIGSQVYSFASGATATVVAGTGTVYVYVAEDGGIVVGTTAADAPTVLCSNCRAESPVNAFPFASIPLAFWHATSAVWDPSGTDTRAVLSVARKLTAGANISITETDSNVTIAADSAAGSGTELQHHSGGKLAAVESSSVTGGAVRLSATIPPSGALFTLGDALVSGHASGTALGVNAPAGYSGDLANLMTGGTSLLRVTALGDLVREADGSEAAFWGNAATTAGSSMRIGVAGVAASNEIRLGAGAASSSVIVNGLGKMAIGTTAPAPANAAAGADLIVQDATAASGSTQVVISAGAAQNRALTEWVSFAGSVGARISAEGALQNLPYGVRPTCDAAARGMFWHAQGGAGVKDDVQVCAKDAADVYDWRPLF